MKFSRMMTDQLIEHYKREMKRKVITNKRMSRVLKIENEIENRKGSRYLSTLSFTKKETNFK